MFAYIDPSVKDQLIKRGQLISLDEKGRQYCGPDSQAEPFLGLVGPVPVPLRLNGGHRTFSWYAWVRHADLGNIEEVVETVREEGPKKLYALLATHMSVNSVLLYGDFKAAETPLVRIHSNCLTGDVFGSMRCDCGPQLHQALERFGEEGVGALVYMAGHEGRGIGLWAKAITYLLQDAGHDTYQANERLGLPTDSRDYSDAGRILRYFRGPNRGVRLLGNNPLKREALERLGVPVLEQRPLVAGVNPFNVRYLDSKREHGHIIPESSLSDTPRALAQEPGVPCGKTGT